ncbi:MAG: LptF/LptG family permease [Spirochaetales bacterium]
MKKLHLYLIKEFIPVFFISLIFFVLILQMVDLFANLWRYLNQEVPLLAVGRIQWLYLPKCISYSLPIALLFSIAFTLGDFHGKNQLIAVLGAGVSLYQFIFPLILVGLFVSLGGFFFQEQVVIDTFREKNELFRQVLNTSTSFSNTNITILGDDIGTVYHADYYDDEKKALFGVLIARRNREGDLVTRIDAESAQWNGSFWEFKNLRLLQKVKGEFLEEVKSDHADPELNTPPLRFRRMIKTVEEMRIAQAREWIDSLRRAGLSYKETLTEYYKRYSFAAAPLLVSLFAGLAGAQFRKNILLMSLLVSLILSVLYYVLQMLMVLLAKLGYVAPLLGAWSSFLVFFSASIVWIKASKL